MTKVDILMPRELSPTTPTMTPLMAQETDRVTELSTPSTSAAHMRLGLTRVSLRKRLPTMMDKIASMPQRCGVQP